MWHKCKNGTLVNLEHFSKFEVIDYTDYHKLWAVMPGRSTEEITTGTREECKAEMAEIEAKIAAWEKPLMLTPGKERL